MAVAPMHVITKPEAGTGGSYLQDLTSAIATSSTDTDWLRLVATLDDPGTGRGRVDHARAARCWRPSASRNRQAARWDPQAEGHSKSKAAVQCGMGMCRATTLCR
jgi:hypothetical protein